MCGTKMPFLYIYIDIPSTMYQDKIISILSFGWAVFFLFAGLDPSRTRILLKPILFAGAVALLGIMTINITTDFNQLSQAAKPAVYWLQWAVLSFYFAWLIVVSRFA